MWWHGEVEIGVAATPSICVFHFSLFSLFSIYLPPWSLSLSSCCHGSDRRSVFANRHGGMARWRSAWQHGEVEIGMVAPLRYRSARWVWVGSDGVFFFFFWWLLWPVSRFVEIGVERVFFCGCCGPCLSLVV